MVVLGGLAGLARRLARVGGNTPCSLALRKATFMVSASAVRGTATATATATASAAEGFLGKYLPRPFSLTTATSYGRAGRVGLLPRRTLATEKSTQQPQQPQQPRILGGGCGGKFASPQACKNCGHFPCNRMMTESFQSELVPWYKSSVSWLIVGIVGYIVGTVEVVPITNRLRLRVIPEFIEDSADASYDAVLERSLTPNSLPPSSQEHQRVLEVLRRLADTCGFEEPPHLYVVDDDTVTNAFCSAGGSVVVYTGLLKHLKTPDELAVVLSHELSHYVARHSREREGVEKVKHAVERMFGASSDGYVTKAMTLAMTLPRSRNVETEADYMGLMLLARSCFNISEAANVWGKLHALHIKQREERAEEQQHLQEEIIRRRQEEEYHRHPERHQNDESAAYNIDDVFSGETSATLSLSAAPAAARASFFLADTIEVHSFVDRLCSTHPDHESRIANFDPTGPWMQRALQEQQKHGFVCCAKSSETTRKQELKPDFWWERLLHSI